MNNILTLKRDQPWLSGSGNVILGVPNPVNVTLHGEDGGHVSGVPLTFLAADSSLVRAMLLTHNEGEKHITLMAESETISCYVSLLCTGWLQLGEDR